MDRLLKVQESEVRIKFELGCKCSTTIHLSNVMHTMHVAFKVQTTSPDKFSVKPPNGFIPPLGEYTFEIILKPHDKLPEHFPRSKDRFLVKSVPAVNVCGNFPERVPAEWFASRKREVFIDAKLKVFYTGGVILRHLVMQGDTEQVIRVFKRDMDCCNSEDECGRTALHIAASNGDVNMVNLLLGAGAKEDVRSATGQTPLFEAIYSRHNCVVKIFLDRGVDITTKDTRGWTALHLAASSNNPDVLGMLIQRKARVDARDNDGTTSLHFAAMDGHLECVRMLIEGGADKDARSFDGSTAMHLAAEKGFASVVELLLDAGADKRIINLAGRTPYDVAVEKEHVICCFASFFCRRLLQYARNLELYLPTLKILASTIDWLISAVTVFTHVQTTVIDVMEFGETLLRAAREGNVKAIDMILEKGAIINRADQSGWTALHCASFKGQKEIVEKLLDNGADVESTDQEGHTPLHCAVETGHKEIVQLLIKRGANLNARTVRGATPLDIAVAMNWPSLCRFLQSLGADATRPGLCSNTSCSIPELATTSLYNHVPQPHTNDTLH